MDSEQLDLLSQATALRDEGVARVDGNTPDEWKTTVDAAIRSLASIGRPFTADDVRALPGIVDPPNPKAWGARFLTLSRAHVIERVGYAPSTRVSVHGHPVAVWQGVAA